MTTLESKTQHSVFMQTLHKMPIFMDVDKWKWWQMLRLAIIRT